MKIVFSYKSRQDIDDIFIWISRENVTIAQEVETKIRSACENLAEFPFASSDTNEDDIRRAPISQLPYTIFFRVNNSIKTIEIARITHGSQVQNLRKLP